MPAEDVLLATPPTTGTPILKPASPAPEILIGMHQPANASAALKDSLSTTANSNAHALLHIPTMI